MSERPPSQASAALDAAALAYHAACERLRAEQDAIVTAWPSRYGALVDQGNKQRLAPFEEVVRLAEGALRRAARAFGRSKAPRGGRAAK